MGRLKRQVHLDEDQEITRYLECCLPADPSFTDAELAAAWTREGPGNQVRARHILFRVPTEATPAQRDSVRRQAESIRARAAGGEDFAALVRQYGSDGTAQRGGDLGFFGRGQMVASFEEAAFALQPGHISNVVETPFGYHVIKLEECRSAELGDQAAPFRQYLVQLARQSALHKFIERLKSNAHVEPQVGAEKLVRELAQQNTLTLRGRVAKRPLVRYRGGEVTAGEVAQVLQDANSQNLSQISAAGDEDLKNFLENLAVRALILTEAKRSVGPAAVRQFWRDADTLHFRSVPGACLLWLADFLYGRKSFNEVLQPTIEDMRTEYDAALATGRSGKAKWVRIRGTWAFFLAAAFLALVGSSDLVSRAWKLIKRAAWLPR